MSAQDDEKTEDEQDAKSSDEHDAKTEDEHDGDKQDSSDEHDSDDKQDSSDDHDDDKFTGEHGEDMSEIGQVSRDKVSDEPSEEGKEEVKKIAEAYGDKKTAVMPGTDRTITGTAVNEWLDDEGNPKFGDPDEHPFAKDDDDAGDGDSEDSSKDESKNSSEESEESKESADQD